MKDEGVLYWIWLSLRCGVASRDFGRLMDKYDDPFDIYRLEDEETEGLSGISDSLKARLTDRSLEEAYSILRYCKQSKIEIMPYSHKKYPSRLRAIEDPPVLLYVKGSFPDLNERLCVGMVGTRRISDYGREMSYNIAYELTAANAVVVSGMALGVDGACAAGALAAGGPTVAVLGCGLSVVYPKEHTALKAAIEKRGAVISEYPPSERPNGYNFPKRNRIISGLCQGVLVVEGSASSGALITARHAEVQGREVFALPGKVGESNSEGPNELIKNGAIVVLSAEDIIAEYDFLYHDCINYRGLRKAKSTRVEAGVALERYGIASVYRRPKRGQEGQGAVANAPNSSKVSGTVKISDGIGDTPATRDTAEAALSTLDEVSRSVYLAMPLDKAVTPDALPLEGLDIGAVITAFTMLEISGLVESLPGGMYIRK